MATPTSPSKLQVHHSYFGLVLVIISIIGVGIYEIIHDGNLMDMGIPTTLALIAGFVTALLLHKWLAFFLAQDGTYDEEKTVLAAFISILVGFLITGGVIISFVWNQHENVLILITIIDAVAILAIPFHSATHGFKLGANVAADAGKVSRSKSTKAGYPLLKTLVIILIVAIAIGFLTRAYRHQNGTAPATVNNAPVNITIPNQPNRQQPAPYQQPATNPPAQSGQNGTPPASGTGFFDNPQNLK